MPKTYEEGYRDGFKDGFEAGRTADQPKVTYAPRADCNCPQGRERGCWSSDCPRRSPLDSTVTCDPRASVVGVCTGEIPRN